MSRFSLKKFANASKPKLASYLDLPFDELGRECTNIYNSYSETENVFMRIGYARTACNPIVESFCNTHFPGKDNDNSIRILDSILSTVAQAKLTTRDGNEYEYARAEKDMKELRASNLSLEEYEKARNDLGSLIDPVAFYTQVVKSGKDHFRGVHELLVSEYRGYLDRQYTAPAKHYCKLVPLYLQPFKVRGYYDASGNKVSVPYSHWSTYYLYSILPISLYMGMMPRDPKPSQDDIIAARNIALTVQTGKTAGSTRNAVSYYGFPGKDHALADFPVLSSIMLGQTWAAHPNNRSTGMVLDPYNWDMVPEPLINDNLFKAPTKLGLQVPNNTTNTANLPFL